MSRVPPPPSVAEVPLKREGEPIVDVSEEMMMDDPVSVSREAMLLEKLVSSQTALTQTQKRALLEAEKLRRITADQAQDIGTIKKKITRFFRILGLMFITFLFWVIYQRWSTINRYKFMVDHLKPLSDKGLTGASKAADFALAYDLPWYRPFLKSPANKPMVVDVILQGYYTSDFSRFIVANGEKYVPELINRAIMGERDAKAEDTVKQILCDVVGRPNGVWQCLDLCPGPRDPSAIDYALNGFDWGLQGGFMASLFSHGASMIPGIGVVAGVLFGVGMTVSDAISARNACAKMRSPCIDAASLEICGKAVPTQGENSPTT